MSAIPLSDAALDRCIWTEAEDLFSCNRIPDIQVDWNAAANRYLRLFPSCSPKFHLDIPHDGTWTISFRVRLESSEPGRLHAVAWDFESAFDIEADGNWRWVSFNGFIPAGKRTLGFSAHKGDIEVDGFFLHLDEIDLPGKTSLINDFASHQEAADCPVLPMRDLPAFEVTA